MKLKLSHNSVSYVKSFLRILGYGVLVSAGVRWQAAELVWTGVLLLLAELLGILEELV